MTEKLKTLKEISPKIHHGCDNDIFVNEYQLRAEAVKRVRGFKCKENGDNYCNCARDLFMDFFNLAEEDIHG